MTDKGAQILHGDPAPARSAVRGNTIVEALASNARDRGDRAAMRHRTASGWATITWAEYARGVAEVVAGLQNLGIGRGEQVGILSSNRPEWHLADLATLANGGVTVPVYATSSPEQVAYVLGHAEARLCFVDTHEQLGKVLTVRDQLPKLDRVVIMENSRRVDDTLVTGFDELRAAGADRLARSPGLFDEAARAVAPEQLATLVYTSGTTGPPKGAMISHANIMWTLRKATPVFDIREGERLLSFLPLSHIAERMMSDFLPIAVGGETWFARSLATVSEDLPACRPTVFLAVPRVWEKLREAIEEQVAKLGLPMRPAVQRYLGLVARAAAAKEGPPMAMAARVQYEALDRVVGAAMRRQLGLDQAHALVTAAAPIHPDLIRWFHGLRLPVLELYGQTEDCGPTATNRPGRDRVGTVGPPIPGVSVRIADDGEILVRGGNVCLGYFKDHKGTAELLDADGWMHSGDTGVVEDGYLRVTGRKKDLIITAAGKNISPQEIETDLRNIPLVSQAVVVGEGRRYLTALLTLDPELLSRWAEERGKLPDLEALAGDPDVVSEVRAAVEAVNHKRSRVESIRRFRILPHDLTLAEGELTPTLKVKRNVVYANFASVIDELYAENGAGRS